MGPLADAVPDSVASRSATPPAGVVEGAVPLVFGSMVVAVGLGRSADATTDEPPTTTTRRNENDAGGRPPFGNGNQDDPGRVMRNAVSGGNPAHHLAIDFHPFVILSFFLSFFLRFLIQELMSRYRQLSPDGSECGCLKAIAVFKPGLVPLLFYFIFLMKDMVK